MRTGRSSDADEADVCVAGAGPVGSLLAARLAAAGLRVCLLERRTAPPERSMAIGVMPPTLRRFAALGLDEALVRDGCRVRRAVIRDARDALGALDFDRLPPPHAFILALPQSRLVRRLWEHLDGTPGADFRRGTAVESFADGAAGVTVRWRAAEGWRSGEIRARFLALCEGARGTLRRAIGARAPVRRYGPVFAMGDAPDPTPWGAEAHLFFTPEGSLESFPLPGGRRRWVALRRAGDPAADAEALRARVARIAGFDIAPDAWAHVSRFIPERRLERRWVSDRVALCGDAAHTMSPIGGQGMNAGLADAWQLADALRRILREEAAPETLLQQYARDRRRVFRMAAARAARGMWVGVRTGRAASAVRSRLIRALLQPPGWQPRLARYFSMWSLPDGADAPPPAPSPFAA